MCGITGFFLQANQNETWARDLPQAIESLHHRGPDDAGSWFSEDRRVGLGHRRLSILDLSSHGHQPMISACGRWLMVFNGEIYNFREIRAELEPLGHHFEGTGDSEVILAAFSQWGPSAVKRFIGMFAIALWAQHERKMYLLRDRLGVKPLYYGWMGGALFFGSELKALRAFKGWRPEIDKEALADYFRYGYIGDPRSIYCKVGKLKPGHWLELGQDGEPQLVQYWSVLDAAAKKRTESEEVLTEELEALMESAFKYRMIADVPVGVFLSGGIDSSILTAILQKHSDQRIKTFTIGFNEAEKNEAPYAEAVAKHLGTEQHTSILAASEAMQMLPHWGELYDEPFGDSSGIPTLLVSRIASQHVKVVLSADGGDELFSGYHSYANLAAQNARLTGLRPWQRDSIDAVLGVMPWQAADDMLSERHWANGSGLWLRRAVTVRFAKISARLGVNGVGEMQDQALSQAYWPDYEVKRLLGSAPSTRSTADQFDGLDGEKLCLWDLHNYLPGDVLTKVDRATMFASIEGREPLIDHRLAEFAFSLPYSLRQGALGPKHLLRKVLYKHVPRELVDRPKQGFGIPLGKWLSGELRPLLDSYLSPSRVAQHGLFDPAVVAQMVRRFDAGDILSVNRVWLLLAFQMWYEHWFEKMPSPASASVLLEQGLTV